jgi:cold-inducible RNA-binding protein
VSRRLYVGNLSFNTSESELEELFSRAGSVDNVHIARDMATGRARGFGFVEMGTDEEAQKAIAEFNETEFGGRTIQVNEARPRPERSGGGGYGDSRGGRGGNRSGGGGGRYRRQEPRW